MNRRWFSHGTGKVRRKDFLCIGKDVIFEKGVLVFHPEKIKLGNNIYVGHYSILHGHPKNFMEIGNGTWIGQMCYLHSAGGITIGKNVGIGPGVKIFTSLHDLKYTKRPIIQNNLIFKKIVIEDDCDIGVGTIILPGVTIGAGAQIGAGSVVTKDVQPLSVVAGVPARLIRLRKKR